MMTKADNASNKVMTTTFKPAFFNSLTLKNWPAVKAIKAKAISLIKSVPLIKSWGIRLITHGPIKIPVMI